MALRSTELGRVCAGEFRVNTKVYLWIDAVWLQLLLNKESFLMQEGDSESQTFARFQLLRFNCCTVRKFGTTKADKPATLNF